MRSCIPKLGPLIAGGAFPSPLPCLNYIHGEFIGQISPRAPFSVYNPANGTIIGTVPNNDKEVAKQAIAVAQATFEGKWGQVDGVMPRERARMLRKWAELMMANKELLGQIITLEAGKPLREAIGEVVYSAAFVDWYSGEAERVYGDIIPGPRLGVRTTVVKRPIGVVGIITPWNFPSAMITRCAAGAIAAGCTCVVKPSELTPFSALALAELAEKAGIPRGVFNVVTGDAAEIGEVITSSFEVRKIAFTGSTRVGKLLMKQSAATVKKIGMELGGNAPLIVFEDANLEVAIKGVMAAKFLNAGQTCICANRIFVHKSVKVPFVEKLVAAIKKLNVGDGFSKGVTLGPLINEAAVLKMEKLLQGAKKDGAKVLCGGSRVLQETGGNFFAPTLLDDVSHSSAVCQEKIFGPLCPVVTFSTDEEVLALANGTRAGLAAYIFTNDTKRQFTFPERLNFGMVGVNDGNIAAPCAPFGGMKESGIGRDGSKYGIEPFVDIKYVLHSNL